MGSSIGNNFKVTIFGQSHSQAVGAVIEGIPAGFEIDNERLLRFMKRRASSGELTTKRTEDDIPERRRTLRQQSFSYLSSSFHRLLSLPM